jgi:hypothetical protein
MNSLARIGCFAALLVLASCGGGGGNSGTCAIGCPAPPGTTPSARADDISLVLSGATLSNSGTATLTATVTAVDINRNAIAGIPVTLRVDNGAVLTTNASTTSAAGVVSASVGIGADKTNRTILVTAVSGALTKELAFQVVGTRIQATPTPAAPAPGQAGTIEYRVTDANGSPMVGIPVNITGVGGAAVTATTSTSGIYLYSYTAPAATGPADIRASSGGVNATTTVVVTGPGNSPPSAVPGSVRSASVRANPSVVAVNLTASSNNRAEIRALFVGADNSPVKNIRVRFDLAGDRNSIGGTFSTGTSLVYTDDSGTALTGYIPGSRFSPTDGLTIRACWDYVDFAATPNVCPNATTTTMTVASEALSVSIGTDEKVVAPDGTQYYIKKFVVQVNDSSGVAKADVPISPLLDLVRYRTGRYMVPGNWTSLITATCDNEDGNRNGVLETYANGSIEDANGNGSLDPRKADVLVAFQGSDRTNSSGQVVINLTYLRSSATWIDYTLTVAAGGVAGTEGRATYASTLVAPSAAFTDTGAPAFFESPYGADTPESISTLTSTVAGQPTSALCGPPGIYRVVDFLRNSNLQPPNNYLLDSNALYLPAGPLTTLNMLNRCQTTFRAGLLVGLGGPAIAGTNISTRNATPGVTAIIGSGSPVGNLLLMSPSPFELNIDLGATGTLTPACVVNGARSATATFELQVRTPTNRVFVHPLTITYRTN